jgi:hypothetical protein
MKISVSDGSVSSKRLMSHQVPRIQIAPSGIDRAALPDRGKQPGLFWEK